MIKIKHIVPCLVLSLLTTGKLAADDPPYPTTFDVLGGPGRALQANPQSEEYKRTAERFDNDVDDYLDVNNWGGVAENMPRCFLFGHYDLKTPADLNSGVDMQKLSLGFATTLKENYLALYYEGFINTASGWNNDTTGDLSQSHAETDKTDKLALFFARDIIGAIRLDLIFDGFSASHDKGPGDQSTWENNNGFGATVQWGKNFDFGSIGTFKPNAAFGFILPQISKETTDKDKTKTDIGSPGPLPPGYKDEFDIAPELGEDGLIYFSLGLDLAREVWEYSLDYALYADLGYSSKTDGIDGKISRDGQFWHNLSLAAQRNWGISEKMAASFKPALNLGFYTWDGVYKDNDGKFNYGNYLGFELQPVIDFGVKYQLKEKVSIYGGTSITLLEWKTARKSKGDDPGSGTRGSSWVVDNIANPSIELGLSWTPVPALALEFGFDVSTVNNVIDWAASFGNKTWTDLQLNMGLLLRYKPQASSASEES